MGNVTLQYSSNNSGGSWWLTDQNWLDMEKAGWTVKWAKDNKLYLDKDSERYLGALATVAEIDIPEDKIEDTIQEWERITGQNADDEGCNCCGEPHSFSYTDSEGNYHYRSSYTVARRHDWS